MPPMFYNKKPYLGNWEGPRDSREKNNAAVSKGSLPSFTF